MFGLIARIKQARAERLRRKKLMEEQDARIARGFRELHTAVELVGQVAGGRGPRGEVVRIGDGFFIERTEDGKEHTVLLEHNPADEVHKAKVENFKAMVGMNPNWHKLQQEALARRSEAWMTTHLAVLECYAARVDACRARLEKAGYTKDHPIVYALTKHAAAARMDFPNPWTPKPETPPLEPLTLALPKLEIPPLELPELPKFDITAPPMP